MSSGRSSWIGLLLVAACGNASTPPSTGSSTGSSPGSAGSQVSEAPLPGARGTTKIETTQAPRIIVMDEPKIDLPKQESFQLLDPGTGPREVLRYARNTHGSEPWTFTSLAEIATRHLDRGTWGAPEAVPRFGLGMTFTPDVESPSRFTLRALPAQLTAPSPAVDARVEKWHTLLEGRIATVDIDPRGQISKLRFNDDPTSARSADALDLLRSLLDTSLAPLPVEPVGINASWRVVTLVKLDIIHGKRTATFTLTGRNGTRWKLHVKVVEVAEQQRINLRGINADLLAFSGSSEIDLELDRTRPFGGNGTDAVEARFHLQFVSPSTSNTVEQMFEDTGKKTLSVTP